MPKKKKFKTRKSILRRFKITPTGKVLRRSSFARHLSSKKRKRRLRALRVTKELTGRVAGKIKKLYGKG